MFREKGLIAKRPEVTSGLLVLLRNKDFKIGAVFFQEPFLRSRDVYSCKDFSNQLLSKSGQ